VATVKGAETVSVPSDAQEILISIATNYANACYSLTVLRSFYPGAYFAGHSGNASPTYARVYWSPDGNAVQLTGVIVEGDDCTSSTTWKVFYR